MATPIPNLNNCLFSMGQMAKNLPANAGDPGSIPWAGKIPCRREVATSLQNSGLENPMDRGVWQGFADLHGIAGLERTEGLTRPFHI